MPLFRIEAIERFLVRVSYEVVEPTEDAAKSKIRAGEVPYQLREVLEQTARDEFVEWGDTEILTVEQADEQPYTIVGFKNVDEFTDYLKQLQKPEEPSDYGDDDEGDWIVP
jgi:hypothetical protein